MDDRVERLRLLEQDHEPDGWPAVRMRDITALLDALEAARKDACVSLVADIRFACGDNGKRMQPELVEYIRELAHSHARLQGALPGIVTTAGTDPETGQPRLIIKTTEAALSDAPPLIYQRVRVVVEDSHG